MGNTTFPIQVVSGMVASGAIGHALLSSGAIQSGAIADTAVVSGSVASGVIATYARNTITEAFNAEEPISGVRCVHVSPSGAVRIAMASASGRMPAVGIVFDNVASGVAARIRSQGFVQFASGVVNFSGYEAQGVFVGRSGHVIAVSSWFGSGGFLSGDFTQRIGVAINTGGVYMNVTPFFASGLPTALAGNF